MDWKLFAQLVVTLPDDDDAIHIANMMISAGELGSWACAHILRLVK
jgi:hypothetical protein